MSPNHCPSCGSYWPLGGACDWCEPGSPLVTKAEAAVDRWTDRFIITAISCAVVWFGGHALVWLAHTVVRALP